MQVVFQNPYASLNPALTVGDAIGEAVRVHHGVRGRQLEETVATVMRQVGLDPALARRYPRASRVASASGSPSPGRSPCDLAC